MNKKLLKILSISLLLFVGFFIEIKKVEAKEYYECAYYTPFTYIDNSNRATAIQARIHIPYTMNPGLLANPDTGFHLSQVKIVKQICLSKGDLNPTLVLDSQVTSDPEDEYNDFSQSIFPITVSPRVNVDKNSKYVKLYYDGSLKVSSATEEEYKKYLSKQYDGAKQYSAKYNLYNVIEWEFYPYMYDPDDMNGYPCKVHDEFGDAFAGHVAAGFLWTNSHCPIYILPGLNSNDEFLSYVVNSGAIVFANPDAIASKYPHVNYDEFVSMTKEKECDENNKNCKDIFTAEEQKKAIDGLNVLIDTGKTDTKTGSAVYYESTKDKWETYMKEDLANPKKASTVRKEYFSKWYKLVSRYLFEEDKDMSKFKKYLNYICENSEGVVAEFDNNYCEAVKKIVDKMWTHKQATATLEQLENDPCSAICPSCAKLNYNSNACTQSCKDENKKMFDKCTTCAKISDANARKSCMGEKINKIIEQAKSDAAKQKKSSAKEAVGAALKLYSIGLANAPELDITFNAKGAQLKCEDVSLLHTIYMIMIILAPILVIVLGSLDFFKAMLTSDEQKMNKFKKQFPKRIIMLVLLIIVPIIVSFLTKNVAGIKDTLLNCVVNGSK